jgi:hypothetical protein
MRRKPPAPEEKQPSLLASLRAESKTLAQNIAELLERRQKVDALIASYEGNARPPRIERVIKQHHPLPKSSPFYGLALPEAAFKQLSQHTTPRTARELWDEMDGKYPTRNADPHNAIHWALRRRQERVGDVIMIGEGKWTLTALVPAEQRERIIASLGPMSGRDRANHIAKTKAGAKAAKDNGVPWGAPLKMTPEKIAKIRQLLANGMTPKEVCEQVEISMGTFTIYRGRRCFDGIKIAGNSRKKPRAGEVEEPDLLSHSSSKGAIN